MPPAVPLVGDWTTDLRAGAASRGLDDGAGPPSAPVLGSLEVGWRGRRTSYDADGWLGLLDSFEMDPGANLQRIKKDRYWKY